jgi:diguanylate cyclase (GGDEF)-like protein
MRIRNDGQTGSYARVARTGAARESDSVKPVSQATPVQGITDQATVMGIPEAELTPKVRAAIGQLIEEVQSLRGELEQARKRIDYLEQLADQDALTPVLNRRAFVRELSRVMSFTERYGGQAAVIYFDVNGMKTINDNLGHGAGDAALAHVAEVLLNNVRTTDHVGRLGGDEFGVILAQADQNEAKMKAAALAEAIRNQPLVWEGSPVKVHVAYGAHVLSAGQEVTEALSAADQAMYAQKRAGSGQT